jgi:hypothetical protein
VARRSAFFILVFLLAAWAATEVCAQDLPPFPALPPARKPTPPPVTAFQVPLPPPTLPPVASVPDTPPSRPATPAPSRNADEVFLTDGSRINLPANAQRQLVRFSPRYGNLGKFDFEPVGDGTQRLVYTGGLIINVSYEVETRLGRVPQEYEFAADNLVMWVKNLKDRDALGGLPLETVPEGDGKLELELYMTGNVVVRSKDEQVSATTGARTVTSRTLRAEQIYYDVNNNRAIALQADLELAYGNLPDTVHLHARRIDRLGRSEWRANQAGVFSSKLPSDPGLEFFSSEATYVERETELRNIFGIPYRKIGTGEIDYGYERVLTGRNARLELLGVPIFYTPYLRTDPSEPLGPLTGFGFGNDRIFGAQFFTTWDIYKLAALRPPDGHKWRLHLDYLGDRGPGFGSDYDYRNKDLFGYFGPNFGTARAYGIPDGGVDNLGGFRGPEPRQSLAKNGRRDFRGRAYWRNQQEIFVDRDEDGQLTSGPFVTLQTQYAYQSDKNFAEQYYKIEFDSGPNLETFGNLTGSTGNLFGSLLIQGGQLRSWMTETRWLPKASGAILGQSFFDRLSYNTRADVGYAQFRPSTISPFPVIGSDRQRLDTGRIDWWQELSLPFNAGPVRIVPYGVLDLTGYTRDLAGDSRGRAYGGGGARSSLSFARTYADASNEIFNVRGLNHKVTLHSNYYIARSSVAANELPLLDRLNDDTIDLSYRTITPLQANFVSAQDALALSTAPWFDPQRLAIRRLVENRVETRDDIQVVQLGLDQRFQTKRGFSGREHTVDWFTANVSTAIFPNADKDNFGQSTAFLEYQTIWNVGDQTAITSNGWFDPFETGARYWNLGLYLSRPDRTNFYIGYRETDPVNSKAVIANIGYQLTRKYSFNIASSYDFGTQQALSNTFLVSRTGTDLTFTVGLTYNQLTNNTGFTFSFVPNLAAATGLTRFGSPGVGGR